MRALDADGMSPSLLGLLLVAGLAGVWSSWLVAARVPSYHLSVAARLEVERIHPIASPVTGRVVSTAVSLGRDVQQGDVLLEVEAERERLETAAERTRLASVSAQISELQRQITAAQATLGELQRGARAALTESEQRLAAADAAARGVADKLSRTDQLKGMGLVSAAEAEAVRTEAEARQADLQAARAAVERLGAEQQVAERELLGRVASLTRERLELEGLREAAASTVVQHETEAERRRIRAPVSGKLGEVNPIQIGAVIRDGERVASIIPEGDVRVVAEFSPPSLGRVKPGQPARLRMDGFPWTQYGYLDAEVTSVATETRDQRVRVELTLRDSAGARIPLQHGMPGTVEIEVERVAPMVLLLRSLGHMLSEAPVAAATEPSGGR